MKQFIKLTLMMLLSLTAVGAYAQETAEPVEEAPVEVSEEVNAEVMEKENSPEQNVTATETLVEDNEEWKAYAGGMFFWAGNAIRVNNTLNRDVYAAGNSVSISEPISADLFAAASDITIEADVNGDIKAAGNTIVIDAVVEGNVLAMANTVRITKNGRVKGHLNAYAANVEIDGVVRDSAHIGAADLLVTGTVKGPLTADVESAEFTDGSEVMGAVVVNAPTEPEVSDNATIEAFTYNEQDHNEAAGISKNKEKKSLIGGLFKRIAKSVYWYVALLMILVVVLKIKPNLVPNVTNTLHADTGTSMLTGLVAIVVVPMIIVLVALTIVGIPLAIMLGVLFDVKLLLAMLFTGTFIGMKLKKETTLDVSGTPMLHIVKRFSMGYLVLAVIMILPFIGWLVKIAAILFGLGGTLHYLMTKRKKASSPATS